MSPIETDWFLHRMQTEAIDARVCVYLCRTEASAIPSAIPGRSLVVMGDRRNWWPTAASRLRRRLEAAGHFVVLVDRADRFEVPSA